MNAFSIIIIIIINKILIIVLLIVMCVLRYIVGVYYIFNQTEGVCEVEEKDRVQPCSIWKELANCQIKKRKQRLLHVGCELGLHPDDMVTLKVLWRLKNYMIAAWLRAHPDPRSQGLTNKAHMTTCPADPQCYALSF